MRAGILFAALLVAPIAQAGTVCGTKLGADLELTADLDCTATTGTVLTIGADAVTITGNGFQILAPKGVTVIDSPGFDHFRVRDLLIVGGEVGVSAYGNAIELRNVWVDGATVGASLSGADISIGGGGFPGAATGLELYAASAPLAIGSDVDFTGATTAISLDTVSDLTLDGLVLTNGTAVTLSGASKGLTFKNGDWSGSTYGIQTKTGGSATDVLIQGMTFSGYAYAVAIDGSNVSVSDSAFLGNGRGLEASGSTWTISASTFCSNGWLALEDTTTDGVDATWIYWGNPSGPTHASNPAGTGDRIIGGAAFLPFHPGDDATSAIPDCVSVGVCFDDADGDGYGNLSAPAADTDLDCADPGESLVSSDCQDDDPTKNPGAIEIPNDSIDQDCSGTDTIRCWLDADADGYGAEVVVYAADGDCDDLLESSVSTDCDAAEATVHPDASEIADDGIDQDCNGFDTVTCHKDADLDGYGGKTAVRAEDGDCDDLGEAASFSDCNDADDGVHPDADEVCDKVDQDCDGTIDEDAIDRTKWYPDADKDGYGAAATSAFKVSCERPPGYVSDLTDCNDSNDQVHPGAIEQCNGADDDCDGASDDGVAYADWYADVDGDGYGDPASTPVSDCVAPAGTSSEPTDCDDVDPDVFPGAVELCNAVDDDCDEVTDEDDALDARVWYADADDDGYGDLSAVVVACEVPEGYGTDVTDCDDAAFEVNPAADEQCDEIDNDCDGIVDGPDAVDALTWYVDRDGDAYGDGETATVSCEGADGQVTSAGDCDDLDPGRHPGHEDVCDGVDQDCDGVTDEDASWALWWPDVDGDGYGDLAYGGVYGCVAPFGAVDSAGDCDDADAAVNPSAVEVCNQIDDDCEGGVDEGLEVTWYQDEDGDGLGEDEDVRTDCDQPFGYSLTGGDCDDADADVLEVCPEPRAWMSGGGGCSTSPGGAPAGAWLLGVLIAIAPLSGRRSAPNPIANR